MEVALFLVRCGASVERQNNKGKTPIDLAKNKDFKNRLITTSQSVKLTSGT